MKSEEQRLKLAEMSRMISELLEVKKERDNLLKERTQLMEAKQKYHTRSSELNERVQTLMVSGHIESETYCMSLHVTCHMYICGYMSHNVATCHMSHNVATCHMSHVT